MTRNTLETKYKTEKHQYPVKATTWDKTICLHTTTTATTLLKAKNT